VEEIGRSEAIDGLKSSVLRWSNRQKGIKLEPRRNFDFPILNINAEKF